jgi:hypothetical protein
MVAIAEPRDPSPVFPNIVDSNADSGGKSATPATRASPMSLS